MRGAEGDPQYNVAFDSQRFVGLMSQRGTEDFDARFALGVTYVARQLKTDFGERLNVAESSFNYDIKDGIMYGEGESEPFEEVLQRGMYRLEIDWERDEAELAGFRVAQAVLGSADTLDGTAIFTPTPRGRKGSNSEKNYFDLFIKRGNKVEATRYLSNLSNADYRRRIVELNPAYEELLPENPTDVELKSMPLILPHYSQYADPEALVRFILDKEIGISTEELDQMWIDAAPLLTSYINTLAEHPEDIYTLDSLQKAIARKGVETAIDRNLCPDGRCGAIGGGGCGGSGGCSAEFGGAIDEYGSTEFNCPNPKCRVKIKRPLHQFVSNCPSCGTDKVLPPNLRGKIFQPGQAMIQ